VNIFSDWLHGTTSIITHWKLTGRNVQKGGAQLHKALFFTTSRPFAELSSGAHARNTNVYLANLIPGARVLDISDPGVTCTFKESNDLRLRVVNLRPGLCNEQALNQQDWENAWRSGDIMKYFIGKTNIKMAMYAQVLKYMPGTPQAVAAWNAIQKATRDCIEDIVDASIAEGYQAVVGNEKQTHNTYPILIVLDPGVITPPVKV
jgi:hypothetical protein